MNSIHLQLDIDGMSCGSCVAHVRSALAKIPGVRVDTVYLGGTVVSLASSVGETVIRQAITDAGYMVKSVRPASDTPSDDARPAAAVSSGCCCGGGHAHISALLDPQRRSLA